MKCIYINIYTYIYFYICTHVCMYARLRVMLNVLSVSVCYSARLLNYNYNNSYNKIDWRKAQLRARKHMALISI